MAGSQQLIALALMTVLAFTGTVPVAHIALALLALPYTVFLSLYPFPSPPSPPPPVFPRDSRPLRLYVSTGGVLGLLLPVLYILRSFVIGDRDAIAAAAPHLFLLSSQIFAEGLTFSCGVAQPVRAFVPVFFNANRLSALWQWMSEEGRRDGVAVGRVLAMMNMAFWSFNLFGFLLPIYIPRAFKMYYAGHEVVDKDKSRDG